MCIIPSAGEAIFHWWREFTVEGIFCDYTEIGIEKRESVWYNK